jgi:LemA protein
VLFLVAKYNGLVRFRNTRDQSFADIDVQLKQRFDLIPNLVSTIEGYTTHERDTLESITRARTSFLGAGDDVNTKIAADNMLT